MIVNELLISIVTPIFNQSKEGFDAFFNSILEQEYRNFECIIVDETIDTSLTNHYKNRCSEDCRFIYTRPKNKGLAASLNHGVSMARSDYIARLDSDDIAIISRLKVQINYMANNKVDVLGSSIGLIDSNNKIIGYRKYPRKNFLIKFALNFITPIAHPSVLIKKSLFEKFGNYDERLAYAEDLDLWLRFSKHNVIFENLDDSLTLFRQSNRIRDFRHWKTNLMVRFRSLNTHNFLPRFIGILIISFWLLLPNSLKSIVYKFINISKIK